MGVASEHGGAVRGDGALGVEQERRFRCMFEAHYQSIYNYAVRRVGSGHDAGDVVSEVFATAWRRIDEVPSQPEDLLWLYGVARRTLSEHRRSASRRESLINRLKVNRVSEPPPSPSANLAHGDLLRAMARLRPDDCEALRLVVWEELSHAEAAVVLECSINAVAIRIHRAKVRLRAAMLTEVASGMPGVVTNHPIDPSRS
jgi:RNA polymerase sigma factor (sigma-70 family)